MRPAGHSSLGEFLSLYLPQTLVVSTFNFKSAFLHRLAQTCWDRLAGTEFDLLGQTSTFWDYDTEHNSHGLDCLPKEHMEGRALERYETVATVWCLPYDHLVSGKLLVVDDEWSYKRWMVIMRAQCISSDVIH